MRKFVKHPSCRITSSLDNPNALNNKKKAERYIVKELSTADKYFRSRRNYSSAISEDNKSIVVGSPSGEKYTYRCEIQMIPHIIVYNELGDTVAEYDENARTNDMAVFIASNSK